MTDLVNRDLGAATDAVTVVCPECGTRATVSTAARRASDFCPTCDYPLFWARTSGLPDEPADRPDDALRRAPGALGAVPVASIACPACGELNLPGARTCVRCGSPMDPPAPAPAPPLPEPEPEVVVVREPVPCGHPATWTVVLVTALCSIVCSVGLTLAVVALVR